MFDSVALFSSAEHFYTAAASRKAVLGLTRPALTNGLTRASRMSKQKGDVTELTQRALVSLGGYFSFGPSRLPYDLLLSSLSNFFISRTFPETSKTNPA